MQFKKEKLSPKEPKLVFRWKKRAGIRRRRWTIITWRSVYYTIRSFGYIGKWIWESPSAYCIYSRTVIGERPRPCVLINKNQKFVSLTAFCIKDQTLVMLEAWTVGIMAGYSTIASKTWLGRRKYKTWSLFASGIINSLGFDANAYHTIWGSIEINKRGECLIDYPFCTGKLKLKIVK